MSDTEAPEAIDDFAQQLLERAKLRKTAMKGTTAGSKTEIADTPAPIPLREVQPLNIVSSAVEFRQDEEKNEARVPIETGNKAERRSRLKSLARRINEWEDDMSHYVPPTSRRNISPPKNSPRLQRPSTSSPVSLSLVSSPTKGISGCPTSPKQVKFDATAQLKSQIAVPTKFLSSSSSPQRQLPPQILCTTTAGSSYLSVAERAKLFEQRSTSYVPTPKRKTPSPSRRSTSPHKKYAGALEVKRIKVSIPKPGHLYPSLTDIEATTEAETEPEETESSTSTDASTFCSDISPGLSIGGQIEQMAKANVLETVNLPYSETEDIVMEKIVERTPRRPNFRPTEEFSPSATLACREIDAMIDSALDGQSFSIDTILEDACPLESSSPLYPRQVEHGGRELDRPSPPSLMHSVSIFRKREEAMCVTPKRTIVGCEEEAQLEPELAQVDIPDPVSNRVETVNQQIKKLDEELEAQVRSIAQVSKALSLCKSTIEFSDSTENVECEKVLLIACQKRNGILNEMSRLRTEGVLFQKGSCSESKNDLGPSCKGNLTISGIEVELKDEFVRTKILQGNSVYHFLLLIKERNTVESSCLLSIGNGRNNAKVLNSNNCLRFPNIFQLHHLDPSFKVQLEVYVLQTQREFLPHETKYHIRKENKLMTPKKLKGDLKFSRGVQQSPAGPDAVRTPNFVVCGRLTINIASLGKKCSNRTWNLEGVRLDAPVEGSVTFNLNCSADGGEEKTGFLTLFDDISGLGAWHRRWAKLDSYHLSFWMYPEDEQSGKFPVDQIALRHCVTTRVCPVHRDVCARANTLLLVTTREAFPTDKNSLVVSCEGNRTAIRHLLSADMREDRDTWCGHLNRALANLRAWDPQAASPDDTFN